MTRSYNNALKALDIGLNSDDNSDVINALSDENLSECLEKAGYENGVADLGKYYIDYYNKTYNASIDDLKEADMDYLVNLFKCMNPEKSYGQHIDTEIRETCPEVADVYKRQGYQKRACSGAGEQSRNPRNGGR